MEKDDWRFFESGHHDRLDIFISEDDVIYIGRASSVLILDYQDFDDFIEWLKTSIKELREQYGPK